MVVGHQLLSAEDGVSGASAVQGRDLLLQVERALIVGERESQLSAILDYTLDKVGEMIEMVWGAAWVFSEAEDAWLIAASHGMTHESAAVRFPPQAALPCRVGERGTPLLVDDLDSCEFHRSTAEHYRMRSALYAPMKVGARTIGVLAAYSDRLNCYTDHDLQLVAALGEHLGATVAFAIIEDRATQIAVLRERDRQARDLHDGVQQAFSSLRIYVRGAEKALAVEDHREAAQMLRECDSCIEDALSETAVSISALRERSSVFKDVYVVLARMRRRMEAAGLKVKADIEKIVLVPEVSDALAWIAREAMTNVLKHSDAAEVKLLLHAAESAVVLEIVDSGAGIAESEAGHTDELHIGLQVMRERAAQVDGQLRITSSPGCGTRIECRVPRQVTR